MDSLELFPKECAGEWRVIANVRRIPFPVLRLIITVYGTAPLFTIPHNPSIKYFPMNRCNPIINQVQRNFYFSLVTHQIVSSPLTYLPRMPDLHKIYGRLDLENYPHLMCLLAK